MIWSVGSKRNNFPVFSKNRETCQLAREKSLIEASHPEMLGCREATGQHGNYVEKVRPGRGADLRVRDQRRQTCWLSADQMRSASPA